MIDSPSCLTPVSSQLWKVCNGRTISRGTLAEEETNLPKIFPERVTTTMQQMTLCKSFPSKAELFPLPPNWSSCCQSHSCPLYLLHHNQRDHFILSLKPSKFLSVPWGLVRPSYSSSVQSLSRVPQFATPWTAACKASLSITNSQSLLKLMSIKSVLPSSHLILYRPLLLPPSIFASIMVFSNESALRIRWPKYWSFSFNISPSSEHSGLISFRMDWLDLLAAQGTFKSRLQYHIYDICFSLSNSVWQTLGLSTLLIYQTNHF